MSNAADALALVKDAKKFEAQLTKLAKLEADAQRAIDNSKAEVARQKGLATAAKKKADEEVARAESRLHAAEMAEKANVAVVKAAQETEQRANAFAKRVTKNEDAVIQDRGILNRDIAAQSEVMEAFEQRVHAFDVACKTVVAAARG